MLATLLSSELRRSIQTTSNFSCNKLRGGATTIAPFFLLKIRGGIWREEESFRPFEYHNNKRENMMRHSLSRIWPFKRTAVCSVCGPVKIRARARRKDGAHSWRCAKADDAYNRAPRNRPNQDRFRKYGISEDIFKDMWQAQGNKCAICSLPCNPVVDHCHETGLVRGLLCATCNSALGMFKDSLDSLRKAIAYLQKNKPHCVNSEV